MNAAISGDTKTLHIQLANLSARDVEFIQGVVSLFTDPSRAVQLADLRKGHVSIWSTNSGKACALNRRAVFDLVYSPSAHAHAGN